MLGGDEGMNDQQVLVGIYLALEKCGCKNLVERTRKAARAAGATFSNADAGMWLKKFVERTDGKRDGFRTKNGRFAGRENRAETDGATDGNRTKNGPDGGLTREIGISGLDQTAQREKDLPAPEAQPEKVVPADSNGSAEGCESVDAADAEPIAFVRWFLRAGLDHGAIPKHFDYDFEASVRSEVDRSLDAAKALLWGHDRAECEAASGRLFDAVVAGNVSVFTVAHLAEKWTWYDGREKPKRNDSHKGPKNKPIVPDLPPDVDFGDLEPDVALYVAAAAGENDSGKITPSRTRRLRRELWAALEEVGNRTAFALGLGAANAAGVPNVNYVRKAAKGKKAEIDTFPTLRLIPGNSGIKKSPVVDRSERHTDEELRAMMTPDQLANLERWEASQRRMEERERMGQ